MVQSVDKVINWLLNSTNPEIDREYGDPASPDTQRLCDEDDEAAAGRPDDSEPSDLDLL